MYHDWRWEKPAVISQVCYIGNTEFSSQIHCGFTIACWESCVGGTQNAEFTMSFLAQCLSMGYHNCEVIPGWIFLPNNELNLNLGQTFAIQMVLVGLLNPSWACQEHRQNLHPWLTQASSVHQSWRWTCLMSKVGTDCVCDSVCVHSPVPSDQPGPVDPTFCRD